MANKLYEESSVSAIATAIRNQNGSNNTYTIAQMAPAINALSFDITNSIIKKYKATTNTISARTFVEFVNGGMGSSNGTDTRLSTVNGSYVNSSAIAIGEDEVFIIYNNGDSLHGMICYIEGSNITVGADAELYSGSDFYYNGGASMAQLDSDGLTRRVFVTFLVNDPLGDYDVYGLVCNITDTITHGSATKLSDTTFYIALTNTICLDGSKIFILCARTQNRYAYGVVCNVSGTTISRICESQLTSQSNGNVSPRAHKLSSSSVFVTHSVNNYLYGMICTISSNSITPGTDTQLTTVEYTNYTTSIGTLEAGTKLFLVAPYKVTGVEDPWFCLGAMICNISGNTITHGTHTQLLNYDYTYQSANVAVLSPTKVFISHRSPGSTPNRLYGMECTISGDTITPGTDYRLSSDSSSTYINNCPVTLDSDRVFISHRAYPSNSKLYGVVVGASKTIKLPETKIDGVTKEQCTTSTAGDVWEWNQLIQA